MMITKMCLAGYFLKQAKILQKSSTCGHRRFATEATFKTRPYKLHKLDKPPPAETKLTQEEGMDMYTKMASIRQMETAASAMYRRKEIRGFCHLYIGQEAVAVGFEAVMRPADTFITTYRVHAWTYLLTKNMLCCLAELAGHKSGVSKGKGGSMHMYTPRCYGGNGIVGAQAPQGAGIALAHKYLGTGGVCVTMYGDGAANQGQLFEAYNMAKLWGLPCLFLCENNQYAMGTSLSRHTGNSNFYQRGDYIPGIWVDGNDVLSVREAAKFAFDYCSSGKPLVMEVSTYRFTGHSLSDPDTTYRTRDEVKQARETSDPIRVFKEQMIKAALAAEEDFKKIDGKIKQEVEETVKAALADKELPVPDLCYDIYVNNIEKELRGVTPWVTWKTGNRPMTDMICPGKAGVGKEK